MIDLTSFVRWVNTAPLLGGPVPRPALATEYPITDADILASDLWDEALASETSKTLAQEAEIVAIINSMKAGKTDV
jgi:hypothetical protein